MGYLFFTVLCINNWFIILLLEMHREKFLTIVSVANSIPTATSPVSSSSSLPSWLLATAGMQEDDIGTSLDTSRLIDTWSLDITMHRCSTPLQTSHTHTRLTALFSRTTRVSRYQKGKTNLDFTEARDSECQWHQLDHMQVSTSLQTDNHASTRPLSFLQAGCPSCRPTNSVKALREGKYHYKHTRTLSVRLHRQHRCVRLLHVYTVHLLCVRHTGELGKTAKHT